MNKRSIPRGSTILFSLLLVSFAAVLYAGWNISWSSAPAGSGLSEIDRYGYEGFSVKPKKGKSWWKEEKKKQAREKRKVLKSDDDLGKMNKGLKDPEDISWPYGREFAYSMGMEGFLSEEMEGEMGEQLFSMTSQYKSNDDGGKLKDTMGMGDRYFMMEWISEVEFDNRRMVRNLSLKMGLDSSFPGGSSMDDSLAIEFTNEGDTVVMSYDFPRELELEMTTKPEVTEFTCPLDGFFFINGAGTPGSTALLLSAVDLDNGPAGVWVFCPNLITLLGNGQTPEISDPTDFMEYITITNLEECSAETSKWWESSREMYDDWRPPDDTRTFIFEGNTEMFFPLLLEEVGFEDTGKLEDLSSPKGPFMVVYVDDQDRLTRIEQPGGFFATSCELEEIDSGNGWWGRAGKAD